MSLCTKIQKEYKPQLTKQTSSTTTNSPASYISQKEVLIQNIGIHLYIWNISLTQESHLQNILDFLQSSIQGEHISKYRRCATSNTQTSTATLHVVLWTNFIKHTCTHTQIIFQNIHHLYWSNCPTRKLVNRSPLWRNPNQLYRFITLQHHYYYCGTAVQQRHFEAQKDGNPKALHHDCGGRWKSKSAASQLWWMLQHISYISLVIQAMWHVAWPWRIRMPWLQLPGLF